MAMSREDREKIHQGSFESFNRILEEIKQVAKDRNEEIDLLTKRVLMDIIQFETKSKKGILTNNDEEKVASTSTSADVHDIQKRKNHGFGSSKDQVGYIKELMKKRQRETTERVCMRSSLLIPCLPLDLPIEFKNMIHSLCGSHVKLVIQKKIFATDLNTHHDRLSMPENQVVDKRFLSEQHDQELKLHGSLVVKVIDHNLNMHDKLGFTKWKSTSSFSYVLNSGWKKIIDSQKNKLYVKDTIQVWSFRVKIDKKNPIYRERLCFAIVKLKGEGKEEDDGGADSQEIIEPSTTRKRQEAIESEFGVMEDVGNLKFRITVGITRKD
ncbi:hypothetical protein ACFX2H_010580 [Malus domestica]|uniref:uncharacterized protein n=1 Tax=Malus domestica TaxID=3750 RepID=UPI0010AAD09B|nr:uncharacterized protein LOC103423685 [Malus domestica]